MLNTTLILKYLNNNKLSQAKFAKICNVNKDTVRDIVNEKHGVRGVSLLTAIKISKKIGITLDNLIK